MTFLTRLALRRSSVTILIVFIVLAGGVYTYNNFQRELFPTIEIPTITIAASYPGADPETIAREVTEPIEDAVAGVSGLTDIESSSQRNVANIVANFNYGEDMAEAHRTIESRVNGLSLPPAVEVAVVRINSDLFPIMQISVSGDRDIVSLQRILDDSVIPRLESVSGVHEINVAGEVDEQVTVTVDTDKLQDLGLSMFQVSEAISGNNVGLPSGRITEGGVTYSVRTSKELGSIQDIQDLVIGYEQVVLPSDSPAPAVGGLQGQRRVLLSDVATVELGTSEARGISRTLGNPSINLSIVKEPDANTLDVTTAIEAIIADLQLPPDVQLQEVVNSGPEIGESLDQLLQDGTLGFIFAIVAVFLFLINTKPTLLRGLFRSLRPTVIIGTSIPLSVLGGILLMQLFTDVSLNFMSLAGLAIAVGRVVDDSIVVLENIFRHIQRGEENMVAAISGTREVGAAIVASTLTTVAVFIPLAFIQGAVGVFFTPFAISVSLALISSTFVALTAVPVLAAGLLSRGSLPSAEEDDEIGEETWLQRLYAPILAWTLRFKLISLLLAITITGASLLLLLRIPITFFPADTPEYIYVDISLEPGTAVGHTFERVHEVEQILDEFIDAGSLTLYQVSIGQSSTVLEGSIASENLNIAGFVLRVAEDAPMDITERIRERLPENEEGVITYYVSAQGAGPASDLLQIRVVGPNYGDLEATARQLESSLAEIEEIANLSSNVTAARKEVAIRIDEEKAAAYGLNTLSVAQQVNQFIAGQPATEIQLENIALDVVVRGQPDAVDNLEKLKTLNIQGPLGLVKLGAISEIAIEEAPVVVTRFDRERSAEITGNITTIDTQAVNSEVQAVINGLTLPPGVSIVTGGVFADIEEGFQDLYLAMAVGIILVYLVMVASLGSLRDPFIIVLSLPLAVVGALVALEVTNRALSLSAMMGLLLLIGIVVTNAIVLITFVDQIRERGLSIYEALIVGGRVRIRPIIMTAFTTTFALLPLAVSGGGSASLIGAELATVVIGGLVSSTVLTLIVVPIIYTLMHSSIPNLLRRIVSLFQSGSPAAGGSP